MTTTTDYGSWLNRVDTNLRSPDDDVYEYIGGGGRDWQERIEASGALALMQAAYRAAIQAALPDGVSLRGRDFIGPYDTAEDEWEGYPITEDGDLDIAAIVADIDLAAIVEAYEPVTLEEIGRWELESTAANPAKTASGVLSKLGLRPFTYLPHPESGRPQVIYLKGAVREALAARPGRGTRTDLRDAAR